MRPLMYRSMNPLLLELKSTDMERSEGEAFSDLLDYVSHRPAAAQVGPPCCWTMNGLTKDAEPLAT